MNQITMRYKIIFTIAILAVISSAAMICASCQRRFLILGMLLAGMAGVVYLAWQMFRQLHAMNVIGKSIVERDQDLVISSINPAFDKFSKLLCDFWDENSSARQDLEDKIETIRIQLDLSRKQKTHTEAIIHSITDAVIVVDNLGRIAVANSRAAELFGFDLDKVAFKQIENLPNMADIGRQIRAALISKLSDKRSEITISRDDKQRIFDLILSGIYEDDKEIKGVVAVFHDITREKEISQMKNDFVSHVSHELKTPLASITAYAEMLVDGEAQDDETRQEFLGVIQTQAHRLNRMIEDILNISRIESGLVKVNKEVVSVAMVIKESVDMIKSYAAEKDITVVAPVTIVYDQVYADRDMISQVVINLLSNAVKYTPQGGRIEIKSGVDEAQGKVTVLVCDTGVGIPQDELPYVFDKFYRVSTNNKCAKGTGLGLNLVKQIVEKVHGGRIFVESRQGEGSKFGFDLLLATNQGETVGLINQERINDEQESVSSR